MCECYNKLEIIGVQNKINEVISLLSNNGDGVDFHKVSEQWVNDAGSNALDPDVVSWENYASFSFYTKYSPPFTMGKDLSILYPEIIVYQSYKYYESSSYSIHKNGDVLEGGDGNYSDFDNWDFDSQAWFDYAKREGLL